MKLSNLGEASQSPSKAGITVRIGLASFAILGSLILAWSFLNSHTHARADASVSRTTTTQLPWGLALDSQHVWVAEPGCDLNQTTAKCPGTPSAGVIGEYSLSKGSKVQDFKPAAAQNYIPVFVALDASGNVWFTDPTNNAIGEMTVSNGVGTWAEFPVTTANATPLDLVFDANGNIWFTEYGTSKIGFFNVTTKTFTENAIPTTGSNPYGITVAPNKDIWFTENSQKIVASFTPTANGTLANGAITEHAIGNSDPHLITTDQQGNIWYSEGFSGYIGEFAKADSKDHQFNVSQGVCPQTPTATNTPGSTPTATSTTGSTPTATNTPGSTPTAINTPGSTPTATNTPGSTPTPTSQCSVHISGIGVDSNNKVWFDDSLSQRVGYLNPSNGSFTAPSIVTVNDTNPHPHDGLVIDGSNNVWVSEEFGNNLDEFTASSISPTPTATTPTNAPPGPVAKTWYFAEGRIGRGFREYLTIDNPGTTDCSVDIQYLYTPQQGHGAPGIKTVKGISVAAGSRYTEPVHKDFGMTENTPTFDTVSSIVTMNSASTCAGVVVERPLYFSNYHGISSGNDVAGMTHLSTSYYFADVPTGPNNTSYLTILNPPTGTDANVTVNYYVNGQQVGTQTKLVTAGSRGTIAPNALSTLPTHVAAVVTSTAPVMVERPTYFTAGSNGTSGGYDVVGAQAPANDWLFAEGYASTTGNNITQEYLTIANLDSQGAAANVTVTLKGQGGSVGTYTMTVNANDQVIWDVNANDNFSGATKEVSAEVKSTGANIVVQREMYFQYHHSIVNGTTVQTKGGTDAMGMVASVKLSSYSFAEGYTNFGYHTWLTLQNPNTTDETVTITLVNDLGRSYTQNVPVSASSRQTVDITQMVEQNLAQPGISQSDKDANSISMTVQTLNGGTFVAERPEYFNTSGSGFVVQGGSDIIGYDGN